MQIHVVKPGETVFSIAAAYGVDPMRLSADNELPADGALTVGQALVVLFPRIVHAVAPGDTLSSIASQYGISVNQLFRNNWPLQGRSYLQPEQRLVISYVGEKLGQLHSSSYAYPYISSTLLDSQLPFLSYMAPFTYGVSENGGLLPLSDESLLFASRSYGVAPMLHLSTLTEDGGFSSQRAIRVLSDPLAQFRLIQEVMQTMEEKSFYGVDVDFEYIPAAQRQSYIEFLDRLRRSVSPRPLWAALAPKTWADQPGLLYEAHDYAGIGAVADSVLLMTYEWGYTAGPPMAVSPLPNVRAVLDYAVTEIPPEKIFLGMSNYGYDWPLPFVEGITRATSLSNQQAVQIALEYGVPIEYDQQAQAPHFSYVDAFGTEHVVWFEDARSQDARLRLVAEYGLRGVGYWNLMRPSPQTWLTLNALYDIAQM